MPFRHSGAEKFYQPGQLWKPRTKRTARTSRTRNSRSPRVRLAWLYLRRYPALEALSRFTSGLKRFAAANGRPGLYHETITWAYLLLIHERMARAEAETWEEFAQRNPELLVWNPLVLDRYYEKETLGSDLARRVFVLPDRSLVLSLIA